MGLVGAPILVVRAPSPIDNRRVQSCRARRAEYDTFLKLLGKLKIGVEIERANSKIRSFRPSRLETHRGSLDPVFDADHDPVEQTTRKQP